MSGAAAGLAFERSGELVERSLTLLTEGSLSTAEVAERVLGLRGNASAAAAAVWTLLAGDPRFVVDGCGVWSLREPAPRSRAALESEEWVVVDVETTGGTPAGGDRITEVAAVRVSGGRIDGVYSSLVNPGRRIPSMVTALTGITNAMVVTAPPFREIAAQVADALRGRVFVAHNASFDWRFVCAEMQLARGESPVGRQLCTVRLARKLLPQLASRSLDAVARYFGIEIAARHRAEGDAVATARLLLRFLDMLGERGIVDWGSVEALLGQRAPRRKRQAAPRSMDSA